MAGGGRGLQGSSERRGEGGADGKGQEGTEEKREEGEGGEDYRGRVSEAAGERQDTGAVCSQLCPEMNVTAMLTLANTPAPPKPRHPAQPWPLGPPSWSQNRRCRAGCASRHNTDPTALLEPWLSSCPILGPWGWGGGGRQECLTREKRVTGRYGSLLQRRTHPFPWEQRWRGGEGSFPGPGDLSRGSIQGALCQSRHSRGRGRLCVGGCFLKGTT